MKKQTLLTSSQRRSIAQDYRDIEEIRTLIGLTVEVGKEETHCTGERGQIIGWRFNENGGIDYVIRLYRTDECVCVSMENFTKRGYSFIG